MEKSSQIGDVLCYLRGKSSCVSTHLCSRSHALTQLMSPPTPRFPLQDAKPHRNWLMATKLSKTHLWWAAIFVILSVPSTRTFKHIHPAEMTHTWRLWRGGGNQTLLLWELGIRGSQTCLLQLNNGVLPAGGDYPSWGFPDSSAGKESACHTEDPGLIPGPGRSAGEGIGYTPVFLAFPCGSAGKETAYNAGDLGSIPGLRRSPGEVKGYPFHIVHGVAKSWTQLGEFHFHFPLI